MVIRECDRFHGALCKDVNIFRIAAERKGLILSFSLLGKCSLEVNKRHIIRTEHRADTA